MEGQFCVLIKGNIYEGIWENGSFNTDNEQLCRNCGRMKLFDKFNKDNKQCKQCSENKINNQIKHKEITLPAKAVDSVPFCHLRLGCCGDVRGDIPTLAVRAGWKGGQVVDFARHGSRSLSRAT